MADNVIDACPVRGSSRGPQSRFPAGVVDADDLVTVDIGTTEHPMVRHARKTFTEQDLSSLVLEAVAVVCAGQERAVICVSSR